MIAPHSALRQYLKTIAATHQTGNATEHSYRPALQTLLEALGGPEVRATNEPRRIACGAPDYILSRGRVPLGHVEAKDIGVDLDRAEASDQLQRYLESLPNLVLTDYLEFRWYVDGKPEPRLVASLPRPNKKGHIRADAQRLAQVEQLLTQFIQADIPFQSTPQDLATRMAGLARLIHGLILQTFKHEDGHGELHAQRQAFRRVLIDSLSTDEFADMYAQTLCYGLFAARCTAPASQRFSRQQAAYMLPKTNPFLRKLFTSIAGPNLDERIAWAVDELAELLARADMAAVLEDFGRATRREDPVVHFYETFLAAYDPRLRESRGVYYTPEPVVNYIVRSVDRLLQRDFKLADGLADAQKIKVRPPGTDASHKRTQETHRLQILDPASGTGTFLYAVINQVRSHFDGNAGAWPGYVAEHLLPRLFGFELLMAPYAVAHMKLGLALEQSGYDVASDQRLGLYLTNALEPPHELTGMPLFTQWLADEAREAGHIKRDAPVMVVLGNPPYSGHSANNGAWIAGLLRGQDGSSARPTENYFELGGQPLGERNPKWLNDDYVKFIRFAQWRIAQTGHGILAFVTNHGYLDNPTFRGMRESLMRSFDDIYLLDLHGNSKKRETTPDGGKDENVFDIQQGVAIGLFVRKRRTKRDPDAMARVFRGDLYGLRKDKYAMLDASDVRNTEWTQLEPTAPNYYFVWEDAETRNEYETLWKITDVMPVNSVGIATARDKLSIHFTADDIWTTVQEFSKLPAEEAREKYHLRRDARDWKVHLAQEDLLSSGPNRERVTPVLYRPFDTRYTYYTGRSRGFHCMPRPAVMQHLFQRSNIALITSRLTKGETFAHAQMATTITEVICMSPKTSNNGFVFPLWLYSDDSELLDRDADEKQANIAHEFAEALCRSVGRPATPEDTLAWIYAILYAPSYRQRYGDFLKRDFPRVPLPGSADLFGRLITLGHELISLHTMAQRCARITGFPEAGSNVVDKPRWSLQAGQALGRVYINRQQYFEGVPATVWEQRIGGYRVAEKWLKDRKGRALSYDELEHYQQVIAALARTLDLQAEIDAAINHAGGWPLPSGPTSTPLT